MIRRRKQSLLYMYDLLTFIERAKHNIHTHRIVRKTTIICLGRQQTHKTFRFISHYSKRKDFSLSHTLLIKVVFPFHSFQPAHSLDHHHADVFSQFFFVLLLSILCTFFFSLPHGSFFLDRPANIVIERKILLHIVIIIITIVLVVVVVVVVEIEFMAIAK